MATKTFNNVRFQLKYDTLTNWTTKNPTLLKGEVAITSVPSASGDVKQAPAMLMKIGDGETAYNDLRFMSGLAANVHSWALAENKPSYAASEITGLADFISGEIQDSNTKYQIVKVSDYSYKLQSKELNGAWTDVAENGAITIPKYDDTAVKADIAALQTKVGAKTVAAQIEEAIEGLNLADTYAAKTHGHAIADVTGLADSIADAKKAGTDANATATAVGAKVTTLIGSDANKSVRTIANEELAAQLIPADAKDSLDTLQEIAAWIQSHPDDVTAINADIAALKTKVGTEAVATQISTAVAALKNGEVKANADAIDALEADSHTHSNKALLDTYTQTEANLKDAVNKKHSHTNASVLDGITADKVTAWDKVSEKANEADLAAIAKSGNINDLVQTDGDVIVFDCGNATV